MGCEVAQSASRTFRVRLLTAVALAAAASLLVSYAVSFTSLNLAEGPVFGWLVLHVPFFSELQEAYGQRVLDAPAVSAVTVLYVLGCSVCSCITICRVVLELRSEWLLRTDARIVWAFSFACLAGLFYLLTMRIKPSLVEFHPQHPLCSNLVKTAGAIWLLFFSLGELFSMARGYVVIRFGSPDPNRIAVIPPPT